MATLLESPLFAQVKSFSIDPEAKNTLVFLNGKCVSGLTDSPFQEVLEKNEHFLSLPKKSKLKEPIYIFYLIDAPFEANLKKNFLFEEECEATLIEIYLSTIEFEVETMTLFKLCSNAKLNHVVHHQTNKKAVHRGKTIVELDSHSEYLGTALLVDGTFNLDFTINLSQPHAKTEFHVLGYAKSDQEQKVLFTVNHQQAHCHSHTLARSVLSEKAKSTFKGKIIVQPEAKESDAFLENKNLLLSSSAEVNTAPELEIYNKDIRCSHGATVGHLDSDALFYLQSRGISGKEAKNMLILSFLHPSLKNIRALPSLLSYIEQLIDVN